MDKIHEETGEKGSAQIRGHAMKDGVTLSMDDGEYDTYCDLLPDAALRLGEWLIAQAIAQGAGRQ